MLNPRNLVAAYGLTRMQEENLVIMRRSWKPSTARFQNKNLIQSFPKNDGREGKSIPIQRLTLAQMKEKRDRGLCFKCDSKGGYDHRCGGPKLFLIEEMEDEEGRDPDSERDLIDLRDPTE